MRRLALAAALAAAVLVLVVVLATLWIEPRELIEPAVRQLSERLGRPVVLGELDLSVLPAPAVRVSGLEIGPLEGEATPLLTVDEIRVRIAILPLLLGRVVLSTLELHAPRVHLELDERGRPILGLPKAQPGEAAAVEAPGGPGPETEAASPPQLAIRATEIEDGSLDAGPWRVEDLDLRGRLRLDGRATLRFEAVLPGLLTLEDARIDAEELLGETPRLRGELELREVDLATLRERLDLEPELAGELEGPVRFALRGRELEKASLSLAGRELRITAAQGRLRGEAEVEAELGGAWRADLTRSELDVAGSLHKPKGVELALSGTLGSQADLSALRDVLIELGPNRLPLELALSEPTPRVTVAPARLELAPLAGLVRDGVEGLGGEVVLERWSIGLAPLALEGRAQLVGATLQLEHGPVRVTGPLRGEGSRLLGEGLQVTAGEQTVEIDLSYDLRGGKISLGSRATEADVEALASALTGHDELAGILDLDVRVAGPPAPETLSGSGHLAIRDGRLRGFSLLEQLLGSLGKLSLEVARSRGRDLSRFEEEEFQLFSADIRIGGGKLSSQNFLLQYDHATAHLHGSIGLVDGALDLAGRVEISEELDAAVAGQPTGAPRVIPIAGIRGTLSRPRVHIDRAVLADLAASYLGHGRMHEKLEEKLGKEGAEAVDDLLQKILRGRKR
ncbi:MAG: AsmA-like C-terminal region-containing protein [Myxococcota bacterium]